MMITLAVEMNLLSLIPNEDSAYSIKVDFLDKLKIYLKDFLGRQMLLIFLLTFIKDKICQ